MTSADVSNLLHTIRLYVTNPSQAKYMFQAVSGDWHLYFCHRIIQNNHATSGKYKYTNMTHKLKTAEESSLNHKTATNTVQREKKMKPNRNWSKLN